MVSVTVVKFILMLYCRRFKNEIVRAYAQDHFFDVITNSVGLAAAVLAIKFKWWIDPIGAIIVSSYLLLILILISLWILWLGSHIQQVLLSVIDFPKIYNDYKFPVFMFHFKIIENVVFFFCYMLIVCLGQKLPSIIGNVCIDVLMKNSVTHFLTILLVLLMC